jgi:hypothetical protein
MFGYALSFQDGLSKIQRVTLNREVALDKPLQVQVLFIDEFISSHFI